MANLNRLKPLKKSKTYRNEYEFSNTMTKIIFGQFVLILVNSYSFEFEYDSFEFEYELTKMSTN